MKCPNCGTDILEGSLYCEKCGCEIQIVPDFEPELENNLLESLKHIAEDVKAGISPEKESISGKRTLGKNGVAAGLKQRNLLLSVLSTCVVLLLMAVVTGGILLHQHYSFDFQMKRAEKCYSGGRYDAAADYYTRAAELNPKDTEILLALADTYMQMGNQLEYEYILRDIISNKSCTGEQAERAYGKLISIYSERGEYDVINDILQACSDESVRYIYQEYLASPPVFNYDSGEYDQAIPLKLTTGSIGEIYYTVDGSEPDANSLLYTAPILLDQEQMVVKAVVINKYGVASEVVTREYQILLQTKEGPEVSVLSGTYYMPMLIEVTREEGKLIYYTTDGSVPDLHSSLYTEPIPMPTGVSEYRFAFIREDGTCSEISERSYELIIEATISVGDAHGFVVDKMLKMNKIYNAEGNFSRESAAQYIYEYLYVIRIAEQGDYYVFAEVLRDEQGVQNRTGSYYAVGIHVPECYQLIKDENSNCTLVEILIDSPNQG